MPGFRNRMNFWRGKMTRRPRGGGTYNSKTCACRTRPEQGGNGSASRARSKRSFCRYMQGYSTHDIPARPHLQPRARPRVQRPRLRGPADRACEAAIRLPRLRGARVRLVGGCRANLRGLRAQGHERGDDPCLTSRVPALHAHRKRMRDDHHPRSYARSRPPQRPAPHLGQARRR